MDDERRHSEVRVSKFELPPSTIPEEGDTTAYWETARYCRYNHRLWPFDGDLIWQKVEGDKWQRYCRLCLRRINANRKNPGN